MVLITRKLLWLSHPPYAIIQYNMVSLIARFMGPTWGPSGADRTQVGPMLDPWTLLPGISFNSSMKYVEYRSNFEFTIHSMSEQSMGHIVWARWKNVDRIKRPSSIMTTGISPWANEYNHYWCVHHVLNESSHSVHNGVDVWAGVTALMYDM